MAAKSEELALNASTMTACVGVRRPRGFTQSAAATIGETRCPLAGSNSGDVVVSAAAAGRPMEQSAGSGPVLWPCLLISSTYIASRRKRGRASRRPQLGVSGHLAADNECPLLSAAHSEAVSPVSAILGGDGLGASVASVV